MLWGQAKGQLSQLTSSHTGARVIQACAKHGSQEDRDALLQEILPNLLDLAKSPYGHFTVAKLIELLPKAKLPGEGLTVLKLVIPICHVMGHADDDKSSHTALSS